MKILVAPLNWGLGHASRCVPLIQRLLDEGHEVVLGGDGDSLTLLRKHFPTLRYVYLAPLHLRYSKGSRQVFAMLRALPQLITWSIKDHAILKAVLREEPFDMIVSDNRFGLYVGNTEYRVQNTDLKCVYMTHQLHIVLPKGWRWLEPVAERLHKRIYRRFDEVWVPDFEDKEKSLSGELGHPKSTEYRVQNTDIKYIGPLSRFEIKRSRDHEIMNHYDIVAVLSGLEPQRTMLEKEIVARYADKKDPVLIVQGLPSRPNTRIKRGNITIVPYLADEALVTALTGAQRIIARSGYSTIMDFHALGVLDKAELIPTPGQPEQEYLAKRFRGDK